MSYIQIFEWIKLFKIANFEKYIQKLLEPIISSSNTIQNNIFKVYTKNFKFLQFKS